MTMHKAKNVPRLPLWKLEMLREHAERRVRVTREAYHAAQLEVHELMHAICLRRREDRERLMAGAESKSAWLAWADPVDVRGWLVPNQDGTEAHMRPFLDEFNDEADDSPHGP